MVPCGENCKELFEASHEATQKLIDRINAANLMLAACWAAFFISIAVATIAFGFAVIACLEWFTLHGTLTHWWLTCCILAALLSFLANLCIAWMAITACIIKYQSMIMDALLDFINEDYAICLALKACLSAEEGCPEIICAGPEWIKMPPQSVPPEGLCDVLHIAAHFMKRLCGAKWSLIFREYDYIPPI
jgi:hypothetical protein